MLPWSMESPAGVQMQFDQLKRRAFVRLLGSAAAWPLAAYAQQAGSVRRIGVLMGWPESDPEARSERGAFVQELQKLGWLDGRNLRIDTRWANPADPESMHRYAKELVALQPDVILSQSTPATAALLQETRIIPVIFGIVADPIGSGFVASFPRPGGNATGFAVRSRPRQASGWNCSRRLRHRSLGSREGGNHDDPRRFHCERRPGQARSGREPCPPRR
jgi:putative tryptophan/tyrosine transport system substrate-binding protein